MVLAAARPLPAERVPLAAALGRAIAEDVASRVDHPPWDNSAMDGFAVRARDVLGARPHAPVLLPVSDEIPAGGFPRGPLAPGSAARVMTGAPVPEGTTGVIRVEHTDGGTDDGVAVFSDSDAERNVRRAGEDLRRGETVLATGTEVTPAVIGALAAMAWPEVTARRRARVAVLSTGDELAELDDLAPVLAGRRIVNSNSHALAAQVRDAGAEPVLLGIARDDVDDVRARLGEASGCDVLLTSAGVSVGDHDHVKAALAGMGLRPLFWRVRMRPGSPMTFGLLGDRLVFGLPGNPVSAMVTFEVFVRPALRRLAGHPSAMPVTIPAVAGEEIVSPADLTHFFRVTLERAEGSLPVARLTGPQGSGILTSMVRADGLAIVPEGTERVAVGAEIRVLPLRAGAGR
jgi:molybdopterin molybdotransferase